MLDSRQGPAYNTFKTCDFDRVLLTIKKSEILTLYKWTFEQCHAKCNKIFRASGQIYSISEWLKSEGFDNQEDEILLAEGLEDVSELLD
ncbi:hypothetical protein Goshw_023502 [Gossypium schwendimanii]|uniref:Uncharacterized protein n=1 Tax=Gossypium schwendimanii TaxID=34291 RepID=A0A7J9MJK1_GOSSC|nr:hypothetical protein [Gossypium schwendimanii]